MIIHLTSSMISYSLMSCGYFDEFGHKVEIYNIILILICGIFSTIVIFLTFHRYRENETPNFWRNRLSEIEDISIFREFRLMKLLNPLKYKWLKFKSTFFPTFLLNVKK